MHWRIIHYAAGDAPARPYTVWENSRAAARRKLGHALNVPWTVR